MARTSTLFVLLVGFPAIARSAGDGSLRGSKTHEAVNATTVTEGHVGGYHVRCGREGCGGWPPGPAPTPPGPQWPVGCQNIGCGGRYNPQNSCQCTYDCERYNNCCEDFWRVCRAPAPTPSGSSGYIEYYNKNAYYPYGATDIDGKNVAIHGLSADECMGRCSAQWQCSCVTYQRSTHKCWMRANCDPNGWTSKYNHGYNVYLKNSYHDTKHADNAEDDENVTMERPLLGNISASNESAPLLYP